MLRQGSDAFLSTSNSRNQLRLWCLFLPFRPSMFIAAKILSFATQPLAWILILLGLGVLGLHGGHKWGPRFCQGAFVLMLLAGWQVPPEAILRHLENQSAAPTSQASLKDFAGVIVLGGALSGSELWERPGQVALNNAAERMTVPVALLQKNPHLRLVFTGGEGKLKFAALTEADRAKLFFDSMGVPPERVVYESASRTTYDNAVMTAQLPGMDIRKPWLLLTSAYHMPRSLAVFRKAGWNVTPYQVDYRTSASTEWDAYSFEYSAERWHVALHETIGYVAYRLAGRI